jgi:hypothetical protein
LAAELVCRRAWQHSDGTRALIVLSLPLPLALRRQGEEEEEEEEEEGQWVGRRQSRLC